MKHLGRVSIVRDWMRERPGAELGFADAKGDLMNAIWRAWLDFVLQKKNEVRY